VPRHPERFEEVARLLNESGLDWKRRSQLSPSSLAPSPSILLVDSVGELGAWWGAADIGFVGGSFGSRGGQNMIEPAAYGVATCFGPNTKNFRDIVATLLNADGARMVENEAALEAFVNACLEMPQEAKALGERARALVTTQLGATARTADAIDKLMGVAATRQRMAA
jgi:3-deoxy-D-manno-octulosonic-acid transferase